MKRLGIAAIITNYRGETLLGRRAKDPNRGLYVFPGGGVEEGETLEQTLCREVKEETGYEVMSNSNRWGNPVHVTELGDRVIIFVEAMVWNPDNAPISGSDLEEVGWHLHLPEDCSPVIKPIFYSIKDLHDNKTKASYYDPYSVKGMDSW